MSICTIIGFNRKGKSWTVFFRLFFFLKKHLIYHTKFFLVPTLLFPSSHFGFLSPVLMICPLYEEGGRALFLPFLVVSVIVVGGHGMLFGNWCPFVLEKPTIWDINCCRAHSMRRKGEKQRLTDFQINARGGKLICLTWFRVKKVATMGHCQSKNSVWIEGVSGL